MNPKLQIEAIIFDVDGVLLDSNRMHHLAWQKVFADVGKTFTYEDYVQKASGVHRNQVIRHLVDEPTDLDFAHFSAQKDKYSYEVLETLDLKPLEMALEFVEYLASKNYKLSAASSSKLAPELLKKTPIYSKLDSIRGGSHIKNPKPHPEIYLNSAKELGAKPENCLVIEDMSVGVMSAKNAGMRSCGLTHTGDLEIANLADFSVYNFTQYPEIIEFFGL